ncbi:MAG: hypothetical protein ABJA98_01600 [Acidobacteriota bacterium]
MHAAAVELATNLAAMTGQQHVVYRMPAWPPGVFSVRPRMLLLPMDAEVEVFGASDLAVDPQRGLFE